MTVMLTLHAGYDVAYLTDAVGSGGADYYLSAAGKGGEPPGFWTGKGAAALGLAGDVDAQTMRNLYHNSITPDGEALNAANQAHEYDQMADSLEDRIEAEVQRRIDDLGTEPTEKELVEIRLMVAGKQRNAVPFFDFTLSMAKSISVTHASYLASAARARDAGDDAEFARCAAKAAQIEDAAREGAKQVVRSLERNAAYVRTGHHGEGTGQWRDAAGVTAAAFPQHTSRDGDPQLHVHIAVLNKAQRADGDDAKWRTLDSRSLHRERLGIAARAGMVVEQRLLAAGVQLIQREDGNGREIQGVEPATMRAFSSRRTTITPAIRRLVDEYTERHGRAPSRHALWSLRQWATLESRKGKHEVERTPAEQLAAWDAQSRAAEAQVLADVRVAVEEFGARDGATAPCTEDMQRGIRVAVHEVQRQNATWTASQLAWELFRAMPPRDAGTDPVPLLEAMLTEALTTDIGEVIPLAPAPDVTDVSVLGVRGSDGVSVYRPPGEARYCTKPMLDTEDYLIKSARRKVAARVTQAEAEAATEGTGLTPNQAEAVHGLLTSAKAVEVLVGPAGAGKSFVLARYADAYMRLTGNRVIGLTASANASDVLKGEGLAEAYNIADFLGKIKDSDETRGNIAVGAGDVIVVDEASQVSTADLLEIKLAADRSGATVICTGDTAQLGAVEAGGIVAEIARQQGYWKLHEVLRFTRPWEARASLGLRDGNLMAWGEYRAHGHVRHGTQDTVYAKAVELWSADHANGKETLLITGTNAEAAELSRMIRDKLISWNMLPGVPVVTLADGNDAGRGDLVRARLNAKTIDAGGQPLHNRDTLRITGTAGLGEEIIVQRRLPGHAGWSPEFVIPRAYAAENTELDYAGNVHVAEGRTVDRGHLIVSDALGRGAAYVGMTRGREENTAHVVTGRAGTKELAPPEAVLAGVMEREDQAATATETIRQAQASATSSRHLFELWRALVRHESNPAVDREIERRLPAAEYQRYLTDPQRPVVQRQLREAELAGHDVEDVLDTVTRAGWAGARSIAGTLHGRVDKLNLDRGGRTTTWAERTPQPREPEAEPEPEADRDSQGWEPAPAAESPWRKALDEVTGALDHRQVELGERLAEKPEPWTVRYLGMPPAEAGPLRDDWTARAGRVASYREAAGHDDPEQATGPAPKNNPELQEAYQASVRAMEMEEEELTRSVSRGSLEARVDAHERAKAWAPQPVGPDLELVAQAARDAAAQERDATAQFHADLADSAKSLREVLETETARLEMQRAARVEWEEATAEQRDQAREAKAELERRGHEEPEPVAEVEAGVPDAEAEAGREAERREIDAEAERWEIDQSRERSWQEPEITRHEAEAETELEMDF